MNKQSNVNFAIIFMILALIGSNIYLHMQIKEAISAANEAKYYATRANESAEDSASNASDASDYARKAYNESFGRQCSFCP